MSNVIGIFVKKQSPMMEQGYPIESIEKLRKQYWAFLEKKLPGMKDNYSANIEYFEKAKSACGPDGYDFEFWVQPIGYGRYLRAAGYEDPQHLLYLAMAEFIFDKFSHIEGIEMKTYWSG